MLALTLVARMEATRRRQDSTASHLMVVEGGIVEAFLNPVLSLVVRWFCVR
jgi:fumarate reductase subunit D